MSSIPPIDVPTTPIDVPTTPIGAVRPDEPARPARRGGLMGLLSGWRSPQHRDGMALVVSAALSSGIGLLYWLVAALLFDQATVGLNSAAISAMTLLGTAAQLNLGNAMLRFVPVAGTSVRALVLRCYLVAIAAAAVVGAVFAAGAGLWGVELLAAVGQPALFVFFVISTPVWTMFVLQDYVLTAVKRATVVPVENLIFAVLKIVLLLLAAWAALESGIAVSWVVSTILIVAGMTIYLVRVLPAGPAADGNAAGSTEPPAVTARDIAQFLRSDYAGNLCWLVAMFGLPLVVLALAGPEAAGTYGIAWQIGSALYLIINGMGQSLVAHVAADPSRLESAVRGMVVKALTLLVPAVVVVAPGSYLILSLFGSEYATSGALLLSLLALSALPNVVTQAAVWAARVQRRGAVLFGIPAALAVMVVGGTAVLMPALGVTGAGVAWLGAQVLVAVAILGYRMLKRR